MPRIGSHCLASHDIYPRCSPLHPQILGVDAAHAFRRAEIHVSVCRQCSRSLHESTCRDTHGEVVHGKGAARHVEAGYVRERADPYLSVDVLRDGHYIGIGKSLCIAKELYVVRLRHVWHMAYTLVGGYPYRLVLGHEKLADP